MQLSFHLLLMVEIIILIAYLGICILLFVKQPRFIFFPSSVVERTPEFFHLPYEDVWLPVSVSNGQPKLIHGWWIQSVQADADVLLYLHGNGFNISANVGHAYRFHELGFSVLLIDYRGYGRSEGYFPNEKRVYQDATVAWNYLLQEKQIPPEQIFIYGHSMGGAIAIDLAVKHPQAAGLIVESSFTSIRDMVVYRNVFRTFPVNLILTQRFESIKKVPQLKVPVLFIHGTADTTVPSFMSQELYHAAPEPKKLLLVPTAEHNNTAIVAGDEYVQSVSSFVQEVKSYGVISNN
ncbi:alpha/beta hydrolase [Umezakia ovalisporum]|jgi:pimeloyl-ACP methyl ester carboxylesterase|uniref:Lysophospholipase n=1 Tax=Umezakia ovalisporum FSS-62 TaxID=2971776 RepID=A0AA43H016_9CYAN|nr:alpha/beta fold hydrolase [Umezakia ovalisporum]MBI1242531.1 alpha/beta fold hydrolase [Nostoc sp. RI_552]MDH6064190.1 lysophospholipase [Umezakia ovalisporum FSS-62]MDH6065905.1 lysophospholipase [Umezakia ovalisporum APH033B]MDH6085207.1 lysophospholipase [Umezakia ovalisporum TAC611]MDH6087699.1 lysophospholipase [Umezakia ovalisporum Ak1311]